MEHILDIESQKEDLYKIFAKIQESNSILFLGAGASVGEKRYLSKEIIQYYEPYLKNINTETNVTKFIDYLSDDEDFSRNDFDLKVVGLLQKLQVTDAHKILARIPWRQIITTNHDLLVEQAFDSIKSTFNHIYDLKTIKKLNQLNYKCSNTEIKYIKLHGCIQDISQYPLVFSSNDFLKINKFYKQVLLDLKNLSPDINFLSIGYSFADEFGKQFLDKFDSYNFRDKKWLINVDPYPNDNTLSYFKNKKICIVKCSFEEFFNKYSLWENSNATRIVKRKGISIIDSKDSNISLPSKLLLDLNGNIRQLNKYTKDVPVKEIDFYRGEEPTFSLIGRGVDVIKSSFVDSFINKILENLNVQHPTYIPIFFVTGDFGIGKTTFTLRLIHELEKISTLDLVAFEIVDFNNTKKETIISLINLIKAKNILFYCDEVEVESYFKSLIELRRSISIEQFQDCNIFFVVPIRENILEKFKTRNSIHNFIDLNLNGKMEVQEIDDLLEKLKSHNLVEYRDAREKKNIRNKIINDYQSDSFISLMAIVTSGKHENDLLSCYEELSSDLQKAFVYTALLHQYKLSIPANWLKQIIGLSWDDFLNKIIKVEGKGILLQESKDSFGTQPDLFFKTKHPLIAKKLIERILPNKDKQLNYYKRILSSVDLGQKNSYLVNDLLKALYNSNEISISQLNSLYDITYHKLGDDPYFILMYSINLQVRGSKSDLQKANDLLIYAESLLEKKNHKFIHRRAVINFELAKLSYENDEQIYETKNYLKEAEELFKLKQLYDPFTSYSYVDYIKMIIWQLKKIKFDIDEELQRQIIIEELFDIANRTVSEGIDKVNSLQTLYSEYLMEVSENKDYKEYLDNLYNDAKLRPYACILLANYYHLQNDLFSYDAIINEMEHYHDNLEVINFLHKYYGNKLYDPNYRIKLLTISYENPHLEKTNPLRYYYYNFVAETYNFQFSLGKDYLHKIRNTYHHFNPEYRNVWLNADGTERIFDAIVIKNSGEKYKAIKIPSIQYKARLISGNYDDYSLGSSVTVRMHFYLYGLMAEIIDSKSINDL